MSAQNTKPVGVLGALAGLVGLSALAGVLVTAMVTPALAVTSMTAQSTVGIFDDLPDYVEINQQSQRNTLWALSGGKQVPFAEVFNQDREEVAWDDVSQNVKDAAVAAEDVRFYEHGGVDLAGITRAALNNVTGGDLQGASTISQQYVKNAAIQDAQNAPTPEERDALVLEAQDNSIDRKLREAKLAIGLEKRYTKQEILLGYLNIAGFGGNTYGIEAAAQRYYSTSAADLNIAQAASLIAIVQQPNLRSPNDPDNWERNQTRRDVIIGTMRDEGMITQDEYERATSSTVNENSIKLSAPASGCNYATGAKQFCDYVVRNVPNLEALGATPEDRQAAWTKGGYDIYTTIDLDQNAHAEGVLAANAPANETRFALGAAASTIQVGTGRIVVMAQNKPFDNSEVPEDPTSTAVNFNTDRDYGGSSGFQSGSSYKLFTLVDWLKNGRGLNEFVDGTQREYTAAQLPAACSPGNATYTVRNDGGGNAGRMSVTQATAGSVNAAFYDMASELDLCEIRDTAVSMGVHRADGGELQTFAPMVLGTDEVAPLTMANAYATVASGGILCQPIAVDRVVDPDGNELVGQEQDCARAISPEVAAAAATALQAVMNGGTGSAANPYDGTPLIGKTGTADAFHTWMISSSVNLATAVWVGNIQGQQSLRAITVAGQTAASARWPIMNSILQSLHTNPSYATQTGFPEPPTNLQRGLTQAVPDVAGQSPQAAQALLEGVGLEFALGQPVASDLPEGQIASSSPGAGAQVSRGSVVEVNPSDGSQSVEMPSLNGRSPSEAVSLLRRAGFDRGNITVEFAAGGTECEISSSSPAAGETVSTEDGVTITVGRGDSDERPDCS
ncbi:transglycosylase domain-containing protein [Marisediminicola sp. LYQ134]|uniref:transglycosylase domain-containing protein n=1 Tax=unclassified Marisediminicola TaxID=2618316 RepID=UPI003982F574